MATVTADKMKDDPKAITILERLLVIDPQNAFASQALPVLKKAVNKPAAPTKPAPKNTAPAKPAAKTPTAKTPVAKK